MDSSGNLITQQEGDNPKPNVSTEREPLLGNRSLASGDTEHTQALSKQLTTRHAFAVLVTLQIGSGIFASPAQVDSNVPSPGSALLIWVLGGLLSWAGAASFAELGAALPLNGGMQEYLRHVYGDTAAFLMAWVYIAAVKPSSMAIQSIVIAGSVGSITSVTPDPLTTKLIAGLAFVIMVLLNSINTRITMRLSESFTVFKLSTVGLLVLGGISAVIAHLANRDISPSLPTDWYKKNWFQSRPTHNEGRTIDWTSMGSWDLLGHYCAAIYGGLWAYDGWDNVCAIAIIMLSGWYAEDMYAMQFEGAGGQHRIAWFSSAGYCNFHANIVASEIRDPGRALPKAIKAAMIVVLVSFELVNVAYYILVPWNDLSKNDAVAIVAATSLLGRPAGIVITILVAISCAGSITSNVFSVGRLTIAASQRHYLPAFFSKRGLPLMRRSETEDARNEDSHLSTWDAPIYANVLALMFTLVYISLGSFRALLTFVGMAEWIFYVSTVIGLLVLRRREPHLARPYRPNLVLPVIFVIVGTLVIVRSAMFAPVQSGILAALILVGAIISKMRLS